MPMAESRGKGKGQYPFWQWIKPGKRRKSKKDKTKNYPESLCPTQEDINVEVTSPSANIWKEPVNDGVELSPQQEYVLNIVRQGKNVFYTGNAGTGKTTLLGKIRKCAPEDTFVTALTGVAAVQAGGTTLHSFAGIGLGNGSKDYLCDIVRNGSKAKNWKKAKVLIIDEVSMLDGRLFDKLEYIARKVRHSELPFGGLQLVMCGDFFQLPPIQKVGETSVNYCFQSTAWDKCIDHSVELTQIYRQSDPKLIKLLYEVRYQCLSDESLELLRFLNRPIPDISDVHVEPTKLYSRNARVNDINNAKLLCLPGEEMIYTAEDRGQSPYMDNMSKYVIAMDKLVLKIGAQVMLLKNLTEELINGSRGVVEEFDEDGWPRVKFVDGGMKTIKEEEWSLENSSGRVLAVRTQVPLKPAWAITIHKSQGMSIDFLQVDLKNVFSQGQAYVALSRARTLEGLQVLSFDVAKFTTSDAVIKFYQDKVKEVPIPTDCKLSQDKSPTFTCISLLSPCRPSKYTLGTPTKRKRTSNEDESTCTTTKKHSPSKHFMEESVDKEIKSPLQKRPVKSPRRTSVVGKNSGRQGGANNQEPSKYTLDTPTKRKRTSNEDESTCTTTKKHSPSKHFMEESVDKEIKSPLQKRPVKSPRITSVVGKNSGRQGGAKNQVGGTGAAQPFTTASQSKGFQRASVVYQNHGEELSDSECLKAVQGNCNHAFVNHGRHGSICSNIATSKDKTEEICAEDFFGDDISDSECLKASQGKHNESTLMLYTEDFSDAERLKTNQSCDTGKCDSVSLKASHEEQSRCFWNLNENPDLKFLETKEDHSIESNKRDVSTAGQLTTPLVVKRKKSMTTPSSKVSECRNTTPTNTPLRKSLGMTHLNTNDSSRKCKDETNNPSSVENKKYERQRKRSKKKCSILFDKLKKESPRRELLDNDVDTSPDTKGNDSYQLPVVDDCEMLDKPLMGLASEADKPAIEEFSQSIDIEKSKQNSKNLCSQLFDSLKEDTHTHELIASYKDATSSCDQVDNQGTCISHDKQRCKHSTQLRICGQEIGQENQEYSQLYTLQCGTTNRKQRRHKNVVATTDVCTQTEHFSNHDYQALILDYHLPNVPLVVTEIVVNTCGSMLKLAIILYQIIIHRFCEYHFYTYGEN